MSFANTLRAFATVFPAELPDKTMFATVVLVTRFRRPAAVWTGAVAAFSVHVVVAVAAGKLLSLLPDVVVGTIVAAMFSVGAVLLFRAARAEPPDEVADGEESPAGVRATVVGSFALVALAEWGDLTQLATASLAAKSGDPVGTGIGAFVALASVAAIAATFGQQIVARVPIARINYVGAAVFAALAVWTVIELLT